MGVAEGVARGTVSAVLKSLGDVVHNWRRKARLKQMLIDPRFGFGRTLQQLADAVGASLDDTRCLLVAMKARPSETDPDVWTLKPPPTKR